MKKNTALILAVVVIPLVAWIARAMVVSVATSSADGNLVAYTMLVQAAQANDIASARDLAVRAGSLAGDQRLCGAASAPSSICDSCLKVGMTTKAEANDLGGFAKSFIYGWANPVSGVVEGIKLFINGNGLEEQNATLDAVYSPQWAAYHQRSEASKTTGTVALFLILIGGWVGVAAMVKASPSPGGSSCSPSIGQTVEPAVVDVEPELVVCG